MRNVTIQGDVPSLNQFVAALLDAYPEIQVHHIALSSGFMPAPQPAVLQILQPQQPQIMPCNILMVLYTLPDNAELNLPEFTGEQSKS